MSCCKVSRRHLLRMSLTATIGYLLTPGMRRLLAAEAKTSGAPAAEHLILLWMSGGPSHIDTFDPKPGKETNGPYKPINTTATGIQVCEHMPTIARNMNKASLIRSLTSKEGAHERATYEMHTGYKPLGSIARTQDDHYVTRCYLVL